MYYTDDVIGQAGQNLNSLELAVLVGMANGNPPSAIAEAAQLTPVDVRGLELSARAKLGARTQPHMIARGFTLGVLLPRALCVLLAFLSVAESDLSALRVRTPRNLRPTVAQVRPGNASGSRRA